MARPRTISDAQLLSAAREVFVEQGFAATTASIAVRAGVSEGTLFKRFSTKEDLFAAALGLTDYGVWRAGLLDSVGQGEVQRNLERAALALRQMLAEAYDHLHDLAAAAEQRRSELDAAAEAALDRLKIDTVNRPVVGLPALLM